ncbi:MAG: HlyD family efflux transporter periplasmic adaptor subunit [Pseudomonadota bacterium]
MSLSPRTIILSGLGLALVAGLVVTAFREDPIPVDIAEVALGDLRVTVDAEGETRVRERYDIDAPISGTLKRMPLDVGDAVVLGETVLASIEPATAPLLDTRSRAEALAVLNDAEAQIAFALAEISRTEANVTYAKSQLARSQALVGSGAATPTRVEDAANRLAISEAEFVSAEARLSMALAAKERAEAVLQEPDVGDQSGVCCVHLTAPADGVVLTQVNVSARPVLAGENLAVIGDPHDLEVVVDLLSTDATRLHEGADAILERWGGAEPLAGVVRRIEPTARKVVSALGIEEQRVDLLIDINSPKDDWEGLGHGFSVFARVVEWEAEDVLLVPLSAVFRTDDAWFTFVVTEGSIAQRTKIEIAERDGRMALVVSGLEAGARVVTHPPDTLRDGSAVTERERF